MAVGPVVERPLRPGLLGIYSRYFAGPIKRHKPPNMLFLHLWMTILCVGKGGALHLATLETRIDGMTLDCSTVDIPTANQATRQGVIR